MSHGSSLSMPSVVLANACSSVQSFSAKGRARSASSPRKRSTASGESAILGTSDTSPKLR